MKICIVVIGVVKNKDKILLRKKPNGSPPYKETWYLFGTAINPLDDPKQRLREVIKEQAGIFVQPTIRVGWDTEIKNDSDGTLTYFVYLDYLCKYVSGKLKPCKSIEKLEWVKTTNLKNYDLVPPSRKLFAKLGY